MPILNCYRLRPDFDNVDVAFESLLASETSVVESAEFSGEAFTAVVFIAEAPQRPPAWQGLLSSGFPDLQIAPGVHPSAILFVRTSGRRRRDTVTFALAFGPAGRFMLDPAKYVRGYGLKTALNLIYPAKSSDVPRLRSVDSKRRDATVLRSRVQASEQVEFEAFEVSQLRDVLDNAVGQPFDPKWGTRVQGGDAIVLNIPIEVAGLGKFCRDLDKASRRKDYKAKFAWIDNIQPLADPELKQNIEGAIVARLTSQRLDGLTIAPPDVLDWGAIAGFRFHFDRRGSTGGVLHPDLRIEDYIRGLSRLGQLASIDNESLRSAWIYAVGANGETVARWPVWRCLVAEVVENGETFILDEGELFRVSADYLSQLDAFLNGFPVSSCALPSTTVIETEDAYNRKAARSAALLLLDKQNVITVPGKTTAIEVCDLLSIDRHLVHVKRHLSSSTLSHLFAQGLVSAELLQTSPAFVKAVEKRVGSSTKGKTNFLHLFSAGVVPRDWKVVYAVAADWGGKGLEKLPFFSKVNLREAHNNLVARGFAVEFVRINAVRATTRSKP